MRKHLQLLCQIQFLCWDIILTENPHLLLVLLLKLTLQHIERVWDTSISWANVYTLISSKDLFLTLATQICFHWGSEELNDSLNIPFYFTFFLLLLFYMLNVVFVRTGLLCATGSDALICSRLTSAGAVVGVQQITVAAGAVVSSDVVVTEMITEQIFIAAVDALVHIWRDGPRRGQKHRIIHRLPVTHSTRPTTDSLSLPSEPSSCPWFRTSSVSLYNLSL